MINDITRLAMAIKNSKNIVVFTGAGISCPAPTNIPDFRSANGLYSTKTKEDYSPEQIISHSFFKNNPRYFFKFYFEKMVYEEAPPNKAHYFFAKLEEKGLVKAIVTQNIDGLHQKSGSKNVLELHGSVYRNYCDKCHKYYDLRDLVKTGIPYCDCGGVIKPDVVLYEEPLNERVVFAAIEAIKKADLLIIVGTSLSVYPAAYYVNYYCGDIVALINKMPTAYDHNAQIVINDDIVKVVDELEKLI